MPDGAASQAPTQLKEPGVQLSCRWIGCSFVFVVAFLLFFAFTAGGLQIKGLQGASLSRCTFSPTDPPYVYPNQPLATDDPPYSTLFESVCIGGGTERPLEVYKPPNQTDVYTCACCGTKLFSAKAKFDSTTGWPSFYAPYAHDSIGYSRDGWSVEIHCKTCGVHLGHVFDDAPSVPTKLRYCVDGVCLRKLYDRLPSGGVHLANPLVVPGMAILFVAVVWLTSCGMCGLGVTTWSWDRCQRSCKRRSRPSSRTMRTAPHV